MCLAFKVAAEHIPVRTLSQFNQLDFVQQLIERQDPCHSMGPDERSVIIYIGSFHAFPSMDQAETVSRHVKKVRQAICFYALTTHDSSSPPSSKSKPTGLARGTDEFRISARSLRASAPSKPRGAKVRYEILVFRIHPTELKPPFTDLKSCNELESIPQLKSSYELKSRSWTSVLSSTQLELLLSLRGLSLSL